MNIADGERVKTVIEEMGYEYTENEHEASLLGIVACSVRQKPIDKVYNKIAQWNRWKADHNLVTFISGCVLPKDKEHFLKTFDFVFPISELNQFPEMVEGYGIVTQMSLKKTILGIPKNDNISDFWNLKQKHSSPFEAYVPIQNGCDKFCTFCAVPYTRGREVSRPSSEIIYDIEQLINNNYKSITLLGQNVNSYGLDKKGSELSFVGLLKEIGELGEKSGKDFWVYFTSPHPRDMEREVFEVIARYKVLAKQIHLPLQSGDDFILMKMNRNHSVEKYRQQILDIRTVLPSATIFTDIIVGFTGETDEQFENTRNAIKEFRFNMAYIAKYSARPGAASSRWNDDIALEVKKKRHEVLSNDFREVSTENNKQFLGKKFKVLISGEGRKFGLLKGYTEGRIPIEVKSENLSLTGQFIEVEITSVSGFSIAGEIINPLHENSFSQKKTLSGIEF
jgi:tRNA-2-methylthio-N6-dimethylallyladenosine synthase